MVFSQEFIAMLNMKHSKQIYLVYCCLPCLKMLQMVYDECNMQKQKSSSEIPDCIPNLSKRFSMNSCLRKVQKQKLFQINQGIIQADFDVSIPILGTSILGNQIRKEDPTYKDGSLTRFKFCHFKPILSLKTSIEQWLLGLLLWAPCLGYSQISPNPQFQRSKIDLCGYCHPVNRKKHETFQRFEIFFKSPVLSHLNNWWKSNYVTQFYPHPGGQDFQK